MQVKSVISCHMLKTEDLFTLEECAKYCGISRDCMYMHYYRGHIKRCTDVYTWRVYFTRRALDEFRSRYILFDQ